MADLTSPGEWPDPRFSSTPGGASFKLRLGGFLRAVRPQILSPCPIQPFHSQLHSAIMVGARNTAALKIAAP
jgi:hypothetical protein